MTDDLEEPEIESEECALECPFCGEAVLTAWTYAFEPIELDECEHLVALLSWGCGAWEDPWIDEQRRRLVDGLLPRIPLPDGEAYEDLSDVFDATMFSSGKSLRHECDGWELATDSVYVEAGLGPQGGGPTYIGVFLRPTPKVAQARKTVKRKASKTPTDRSPRKVVPRPRSVVRRSSIGVAKEK